MIFRRAAVLAAFAVICAAASVQGEPETEQPKISAVTVVDVSRDVEEALEAQQELVKAQAVTEKMGKCSKKSFHTFIALTPIAIAASIARYVCNKAGEAAPANPKTGAGQLGKMAAAGGEAGAYAIQGVIGMAMGIAFIMGNFSLIGKTIGKHVVNGRRKDLDKKLGQLDGKIADQVLLQPYISEMVNDAATANQQAETTEKASQPADSEVATYADK
eukprot:GHVT01031005.1.p1 GENE.GHVT01031005.1~~GHVT01031005.1.p1  ORF type:complete len:217 (+),score=46.65 GHVT01031005.1:481-1131(+)